MIRKAGKTQNPVGQHLGNGKLYRSMEQVMKLRGREEESRDWDVASLQNVF